MTKTMADVIADSLAEWPAEDSAEEHAVRVAAALSAAGFGLVADAQREAWDEGYGLGVDDERTSQANPGIAGCFCHGWPCRCFIAPARNNPYRTEASS